MVGGIAHPILGRSAHLLYELEIHDKLGGLKQFEGCTQATCMTFIHHLLEFYNHMIG
jgi:hypothetical protein